MTRTLQTLCALFVCTLAVLAPSCLADEGPATVQEPPVVEEVPPGSLAIQVGALELPEVTSAVYVIQVRNDDDVLVGAATINSSDYGSGQGSASYVMPCDADPLVQPNHVSATLVQLYAGLQPVSAVMPPTATQDVPCAPSQDHLVTFDFSVIRSANQGFFDIKATVEDIFCAAKADVQATARAGSAAAVTVGFACGAGAVGEVDTHLYMSDVEVSCKNLGNATIKTATITPDGNGYLPANQITDVDPNNLISTVKVYRGPESLQALDALYWNLSFDLTTFAALDDCTLVMQATATDGALVGVGSEGTAPYQTATNYPIVEWAVPLSLDGDAVLGSSPVGGETAPFDGVQVQYPDDGWVFENHYGGP